jgi:hypothetical protein
MAAPLTAWCKSTLDLLRLMPPEQLAPVPEIVRMLINGAVAVPAAQGVTLSTSLPLAMIQKPLARKLGTGGPAAPRPQ